MRTEAQKKADKKYQQSEKGKKTMQRYWQSKKGRANQYKNYHNNIEKRKVSVKKTYEDCKCVLYRLKINGCTICGYNKCMASLDFHHVVSEDKKFTIGASSMRRSNKSIVEEINKCILLCSNCHRQIHYEELE